MRPWAGTKEIDMLFKGLYSILFDHAGYEQLAGAGSTEYAAPFRNHLVQSLVGSGVAIALALVIAMIAGRIELSGPMVAWNKVFASTGGFLIAWGTWFGVTERNESYKKLRMDERLRDFVFIGLFLPGVIIGALGALW
jgi:hypothetical protein